VARWDDTGPGNAKERRALARIRSRLRER